MSAVLLALLFAQALPQAPALEKEQVALIARPREPDGFLQKLSKEMRALVRRLYQKEEPHAAQGNALAAEGKAQEALDAYQQVQVPEDSPAEGAVAFDRSGALLKLGAESAPKAVQEASRALEKGAPPLKSQAAYQLGLGLEQLGKPEEAMTAYAQALQLDSTDQDAKVNLELLLRSKKEEKKKEKSQDSEKKKESQKSSEQKDDQKQQGGKDQKDQKKSEEEGEKKKQEQSQGKPKEAEKKDEKPGEQKKDQEQKPGQPQPLDRSEAQRLLDALRSGEKNLQVWRFAQKKTKEGKRPDAAKDW